MSTKIYQAYEWHGSVPSLFSHLKKIRESYMNDVMAIVLGDARTSWICRETADSDYPHLRFADRLAEEIEKEFKRGTYDRFNFHASAVVYFHRDRVFVQFFGIDTYREQYRKLIKHRNLKDYHYQNQTDAPESVTNKEWKKRERIWDIIFKDDDVPRLSGLNFEFAGYDDISKITNQISYKTLIEKNAKYGHTHTSHSL